MKTVKNSFTWQWMIIILTGVILSSCEGMFDNPLKDKETGDDINLLIVDFNFFRTHITVNLLDAATEERILSPATISLSGNNGNDIVNYSGQKHASYEILNGQLELTVDPNIQVSESSPLTFAVSAGAEGYRSISKTETFRSEGKKSVNIYLSSKADESGTNVGGGINISDGDTSIVFGLAMSPHLKSATAEPSFVVEYSMSIADFLKFTDENGNLLYTSQAELIADYNADPESFLYLHISKFSNYPSWPDLLKIDGVPHNVILQLLETGTVEYMSVGGTKVGSFNGAVMTAKCIWAGDDEPGLWGYATFESDGWLYQGEQIDITNLPHFYTVIEASDLELCPMGVTIRFEAGFKSSFSITADVYDMQNKRLFIQNFTGNFPASFRLENVPDVPAKLVFRNNNPSFKPLPDMQINSLCSGNQTVTVMAQDGFKGYQIVLKAFCENNPTVAVAPTYSGEYRFLGTDNVWQGGFMEGGVLDLLGKPDQEYEYRLLWENEWEVTTFTTTFNTDGSYPFESDSRISAETLSDGRTRINISHTFKQRVCDTMNW